MSRHVSQLSFREEEAHLQHLNNAVRLLGPTHSIDHSAHGSNLRGLGSETPGNDDSIIGMEVQPPPGSSSSASKSGQMQTSSGKSVGALSRGSRGSRSQVASTRGSRGSSSQVASASGASQRSTPRRTGGQAGGTPYRRRPIDDHSTQSTPHRVIGRPVVEESPSLKHDIGRRSLRSGKQYGL